MNRSKESLFTSGKQRLLFTLCWFSYFSLYLTRKNFSVAKSELTQEFSLTTQQLGQIDTLYLIAYAIGQFLSGLLGDYVGAKFVMILGLIGTGLCSFFFGVSSHFSFFALAFCLNGFFQSTGWASNIKALTPWFSVNQRGRIMGLWSTSYAVGGLVATWIAATLIDKFNWRSSFQVPAFWPVIMGVIIYFFLPLEKKHTGARSSNKKQDKGKMIMHLLKSYEVWCLGLCYAFLKIIRYSLLFWLPFYLHGHYSYTALMAGKVSMGFEIGGILGTLGMGWLVDHYLIAYRNHFAIFLLCVLSSVFMLYQWLDNSAYLNQFIFLMIIGMLLFGPDSMVSTLGPQDVGGEKSVSTAAGVVNGIGSLGGLLSGVIPVFFSQRWGWGSLFYVFTAMGVLSALCLIPCLMAQPQYKEESEKIPDLVGNSEEAPEYG